MDKRSDFLLRLIDSIPVLLFIVDSDVRIHHLNRCARAVLELKEGDALMMGQGDILHCVNAVESPGGCGRNAACAECVIRQSVGKALREEEVCKAPTAMRLYSGGKIEDRYFSVSTNSFVYGRQKFVILMLEDITQQRMTEEALVAAESQLRNVLSVLGAGVLVLDSDGRLTFINPEAQRLLGWTEGELIGREVGGLVGRRQGDGTLSSSDDRTLLRAVSAGEMVRVEDEILIKKDGTRLPVSIVGCPIRDGESIMGFVISFHDITAVKNAQEDLEQAIELLKHQASTDPLTGAFNRLKFEDVLSKETSRARRYKIPVSLIMFDIDRFKDVNDDYGHNVGDSVLRQITAFVSKHLRKHDHFARWGGDEFMVLVTHNTKASAAMLAEKLRSEIEGLTFDGPGTVTCSFGVAEFTEQDGIFDFTKRVDDALYKAKQNGRNRTEVL